MRNLNAIEYRSLVSRIMGRFGGRLRLLKVDACELADLVLFGDSSEDKLMDDLEKLSAYKDRATEMLKTSLRKQKP